MVAALATANTIAARIPAMLAARGPCSLAPLPAPEYLPPRNSLPPQAAFPQAAFPQAAAPAASLPTTNIFLALESFRRHMTDEGWQLQIGLADAGYPLHGPGFPAPNNIADVPHILTRHASRNAGQHSSRTPTTIIVQDKREWDSDNPCAFDKSASFRRSSALASHHEIFRVTILKDAQNRPDYHAAAAAEIGCHAWIIYYHPKIVSALAPFVRPEHLIRTYHSVDPAACPEFSPLTARNRSGCLLSGAFNRTAYPLRMRLVKSWQRMHHTTFLKHPRYGADGCHTPRYLQILSNFKVAICTSSVYGYALRKIMEATACGCKVITDLPEDEQLPEIDGNLIRVAPDISIEEINRVIREAIETYDVERQQQFAAAARQYYDYRRLTAKLAADIETMRTKYA